MMTADIIVSLCETFNQCMRRSGPNRNEITLNLEDLEAEGAEPKDIPIRKIKRFSPTGLSADFARQLAYFLSGSRNTFEKVLFALRQLQVPVPIKEEEFVCGHSGMLLFTNQYGFTVRIENDFSERCNDSPLVLQPLISVHAGNALIEICPGVYRSQNLGEMAWLKKSLKRQGIDFWDDHIANIGALPVKTPKFPRGIPLVIDRGAVCKLTDDTADVKRALDILGVKNDPQSLLYAPLRKALDEAWPEKDAEAIPEKMAAFWALCGRFVTEKRMIPGWKGSSGIDEKTKDAEASALALDKRLDFSVARA